MDTGQICSGCKKLLALDAPQGLCPECLIKAGLGTGVDIGPDSQSENTHTRFVAPSVEELAKAFPPLEILGFIGQGGMGAVYKARQKSLDRVVALKILPPGIGDAPAFAERFAREAKALARLNHPGIVTLYEFGQADGQFYFLMEFVDGVNLRHLLEAGRLSPREALAIVPQLCDALQYAHDQGIVHRDIKPENILLDRLGRVKVADFGLAKLVGTAEETLGGVATLDSVVLTEAGKVMGTPQYMAPEQSGNPATVDHRADIYSLGVVLYQMLTGELPGKPLQPPSHKVQIDVRLDEVVLRALENEPQLRYQQVSLVKTAVESITQSSPQEEVAPKISAQSPSTSVGTLIKSDRGRFTTPEYLNTAMGGFWCFKGKGELSLFPDRLVFTSGWQRTEIPFANLTGLSLARLSRSRSPVGHTLLSIIFNDAGQTRRLLFFPGEGLFRFAGDSRDAAAEWILAIRNAAKAATGNSFPDMSEKPDVVQASPWGMLAVFAPLLFIQGYFLLTSTSLSQVYRPEAGFLLRTSLLPTLIIFIIFCFLLVSFLVSSLQARRKSKDISTLQALPQEEVSQHSSDWKTWTPFQSPKVRAICAHMTEAEKRTFTLQNYWFTVWTAATFFVMFFVVMFMSEPLGWIIALTVFLIGLASYPFGLRMQHQLLCKTAWAQQHAIQPDQLKASTGSSAGILIVGRRDGKAVIRWAGVLMVFVLVLAIVGSFSILTSLALMHSIDERAMFIAFMFVLMFTGMSIGLGLRTPVERLTPLDGVSETNTATRGEQNEQATAMNQESSGTKRMSRAAVWGAIWAVISLSFLFLIGLRMMGPERVSFSSWISLLLLPLILLGLTGPFGATILGWHSVSQIRRSEGRLYGMGLSVFDGLLFPLLVLNGVIGQMWCIVISCVLGILSGHFSTVPYDNHHNALDTLLVDHRVWFVFALAFPICGVLNYFIVRSVWRAVNKPLVPLQPTTDTVSTPDTESPSRSKRTWRISIIIGLVFLFIAASLGSLELYSRFSVKSHGQISASAPFVARFPQGTIELVAVSSHPSTLDQPWWRPDGSPYTGEILELRGIHCTADANQLAREFVIRRKGLPEDVSFPVVKLEPSASMGIGGVYSIGKQDSDLYGIAATMPKTAQTVMLKVGISVGLWGKVVESKRDGSCMFSVNYQGQNWSVSFSAASEIGGNACITVTHTPKDWDVRVVAVDKDGKEHTCSEVDSTCTDAFTNTTATFDGLPLANVKEFQFQVRPYHWVEFKNVSLQPGERTCVELVYSSGTPQS